MLGSVGSRPDRRVTFLCLPKGRLPKEKAPHTTAFGSLALLAPAAPLALNLLRKLAYAATSCFAACCRQAGRLRNSRFALRQSSPKAPGSAVLLSVA